MFIVQAQNNIIINNNNNMKNNKIMTFPRETLHMFIILHIVYIAETVDLRLKSGERLL